jgi:hypothetical protein
MIAGYGESKYTEVWWINGCLRMDWGLELGAYGSRTQNAMRTEILLVAGILRPQMISIGRARMRISVVMSKAVATCHRRY